MWANEKLKCHQLCLQISSLPVLPYKNYTVLKDFIKNNFVYQILIANCCSWVLTKNNLIAHTCAIYNWKKIICIFYLLALYSDDVSIYATTSTLFGQKCELHVSKFRNGNFVDTLLSFVVYHSPIRKVCSCYSYIYF